MLVLNFNYNAFKEDLEDVLVQAANESMQRFYNEIRAELKSKDFSLSEAVIDKAEEYIYTQCIFYANSIMESYGTGIYMDESNPYLPEYKQSPLWNKLRKSNAIVGRPAGEYINILGQQSYSTGSMAGIKMPFKGRQPTYTIQNAEKHLKNGYVERIIERYITEFISGAGKYFFNTES